LGLQNLHKNGILHCNLKPSNILVDEYGNIKLCDFKKALKTNLISQTDIRRNKSAMTPCYTAPELFSEDGMYNFKTDLWALGCIMYEMAVGNVPFYDESVGKLMQKIVNDEIDFNKKELRNFSDNFVDILRRLLEKDTSLRITWNEIERHSFWELNLQSDNTKDESNSFTLI
jgi:serine/threonine-protein kinase ULK4